MGCRGGRWQRWAERGWVGGWGGGEEEEEEQEEEEEKGEEEECGWDEKRRGRRMSIGTRVLVDEGTAPGVSGPGRRAFPFFRANRGSWGVMALPRSFFLCHA